MTQRKKQNRALYTCLIFLLIAGAVFLAVAFGAGRRAAPGGDVSGEQTDAVGDGTDTGKPMHTSGKSDGESPVETDADDETEEKRPTSLSIDEIEFVSPVKDGAVLSECSLSVPVYSLTMNDYRVHTGVDIAAEKGASVVSCAAGTVSAIYEDAMMGKTVIITHADGIESVYKNLSAELAEGTRLGAELEAGDLIGSVGDTALIECEEDSHLHFELMVDSQYVDPAEYIEMTSIDEVYEG